MRKRQPLEPKQRQQKDKCIIGTWMLAEGFPFPTGRPDNKLISRVGWITYCDEEKCIVDDGRYQTTLYNYNLIYEIKQ